MSLWSDCGGRPNMVKYEEVYTNDYASRREARAGLSRYLAFYNHARPHQALAYRTPAEVYMQGAGKSKQLDRHERH
jgi:transposase InsO family protein